MTIHTRRGLATHGFRGITGQDNRRLAVATQGVRGYISALISAARNYTAELLGQYFRVEIFKGW